MNKAIIVKDLYKFYRVGDSVVRALDGVSFEVSEGEFCAIVGTSGSGKSTLLNMLAGLEKPTRGQVVIDGHHIEKLNENELVKFRRDNVGFVFQSFHLLGTMNALENVALPLTFRGESLKSRMKKADEMLKLVGLTKHRKHLPRQMSGGQQQRVGVARALVADPRILYCDEPTGNLDSHTSEDVMRLMQRVVREQNRTMVMVTHDDHLAQYADRIFHIIDGKIVKIEDNRKITGE
ncbi:MAG TPA: ABC transporter ATP-binding protein [Candidatus Mediterraneibacter quadrami]|uniref:ABC transporter ATP-binding protein n=1 Tax=Candidatus Mediterraneibacter quadrami TaxID=2838684 RepID=A0A9D2RD14_9FIRM|nr:ABC transporter ATP-binding protein [Candidatus Mediterraneibacter quadrami]